MTYLLSSQRKSLNVGVNIYESATVSSLADDEPISWSTTLHSHGSSYNFSLTFDGTTWTLPSDSHVYHFEAAPIWYGSTYAGDYRFGWYNTTTSSFVGTYGHITGGRNVAEGTIGGLVADEMATYITSSAHNLELRLISSATSYLNQTHVDYAGTSLYEYFNKARVIVYKYEQ